MWLERKSNKRKRNLRVEKGKLLKELKKNLGNTKESFFLSFFIRREKSKKLNINWEKEENWKNVNKKKTRKKNIREGRKIELKKRKMVKKDRKKLRKLEDREKRRLK